jgi:anti-sigma-K factor RskA
MTRASWWRVAGIVIAIVATMAAGMLAVYAYLMMTGPRL